MNISWHAINRFCERVRPDMDFSEAEAEIARRIAPYVEMGLQSVSVEFIDCKIQVCKDVVTTVLTPDMLERRPKRKGPEPSQRIGSWIHTAAHCGMPFLGGLSQDGVLDRADER